MENFTRKLWTDLQENLKISVMRAETEKDRFLNALKHTVVALHELKQYVYGYAFRDREEEILFNRELAPPFNTEYIYCLRCIKIMDHYDGAPDDARKKGLLKERKELNRFFERHAALFQYVKAGYRYLDDKYFVRDPIQLDIPFSDECANIVDDRFVTINSYRLSQLRAYERLLVFLENRRQAPRASAKTPPEGITEPLPDIKWTDRKIDLVELAYAICYKGSVNRGNVSVKEIAVALGRLFNVRLDNILYQTRQQMLERKAGDYYLESLMAALREGPGND